MFGSNSFRWPFLAIVEFSLLFVLWLRDKRCSIASMFLYFDIHSLCELWMWMWFAGARCRLPMLNKHWIKEIEKTIFFPIPFNRIYELCANPNIIDFGWWTFFQWIDNNNNNKTLNSFEFDPGSTVNLFRV